MENTMNTRELIAARLYVSTLKKVNKINKEVHEGIANVVLDKTHIIVPYARAKMWADELKIKEELNARVS